MYESTQLVVDCSIRIIIIFQKSDCYNAAAQINADLNALYQFGHPWNIEFAPHKTFSLIISLKTDISEHPPLFLNDYN